MSTTVRTRAKATPSDPASEPAGHAGSASLRRALAAFSRVAAAADDSADLDGLLHVVARHICELVGVERCSIHLRDEKAGLFLGCVCYAGEPTRDADIKRSRVGGPSDRLVLELLRTKRPVIVDNAHQDPRIIKSTVRFWKIHAIMAVPMIFQDEVIGVIFLDDMAGPHVFTAEDAEMASTFGDLAAVAVMHAQSRAELRAQVDAAQRHINALRRSSVVDERLSDLVLEGATLHELLEALAVLLVKPCAVFDADNTRLATAAPPGTDDGIAPRILESPYIDRPEVREALAAHDGSRTFVVGPLPLAGVMHRYVIAPIIVGAETWGRLVVMEHKSRFVGGDMLTLRRAATLIALQVGTERQAIEADWDAGASLAAEVLGGCCDETVLRRRAERIGFRLDAPRAVMLIGPRSRAGAATLDFRAVAAAFRKVAPELRRARDGGQRRRRGPRRAAARGSRARRSRPTSRTSWAASDRSCHAATGSSRACRRCAASATATAAHSARRARSSSASAASRRRAARRSSRRPTWGRGRCSWPRRTPSSSPPRRSRRSAAWSTTRRRPTC